MPPGVVAATCAADHFQAYFFELLIRGCGGENSTEPWDVVRLFGICEREREYLERNDLAQVDELLELDLGRKRDCIERKETNQSQNFTYQCQHTMKTRINFKLFQRVTAQMEKVQNRKVLVEEPAINDKLSQVGDHHARVGSKGEKYEWLINIKRFERDWCYRAFREDKMAFGCSQRD